MQSESALERIVPEIAFLLARVMGCGDAGIMQAVRFAELEDWSSLTALRLLAAVESYYKIKIDLRSYIATEDIESLAALVSSKRGLRR